MNLSVIVTIVDDGETLERCLTALTSQHDPPEIELIVPWDDTVMGTPDLARRFPSVRFHAMGHVDTARPPASAAGQHELFDRRRAAGLAIASGAIIAILEDRGVPRSTWARTMVTLHERWPHNIIGGAIENGRDNVVNWAVYFCDFSRYQLPFEMGARPYVSDVNIAYKRRAIEMTAELWRHRYHETTVHWALQQAGEALYLSPEPVVDQLRRKLQLRSQLGERFAWGRLFAYTRAAEVGAGRRLMLAALAPLLPGLLLARHARIQFAKRVTRAQFVRAAPAMLVLLIAWSLGEMFGYLTRKA